eukprot:Trichotokara_eunicae@DN3754_c0_g1_i4.p2
MLNGAHSARLLALGAVLALLGIVLSTGMTNLKNPTYHMTCVKWGTFVDVSTIPGTGMYDYEEVYRQLDVDSCADDATVPGLHRTPFVKKAVLRDSTLRTRCCNRTRC